MNLPFGKKIMFYYYQVNINNNTSRCIGKSYLLTNCKIIRSPQKQISEGFFCFLLEKIDFFFKVAKMQFLPLVGNAFLRFKANATTFLKHCSTLASKMFLKKACEEYSRTSCMCIVFVKTSVIFYLNNFFH